MDHTLLNNELGLISNDFIKNLVIRVLDTVVPPWYDAVNAGKDSYRSALTGKTITILDRVKSSVAICKILLGNPLFMSQLPSPNSKDLIYAALILRDMNMYGVGQSQGEKSVNHYELTHELLPSGVSQVEIETLYQIFDLIKAHHGPYSNPPVQLNSMEKYMVHLCDYLASKSTIEVAHEVELSWK